MTEDLVIPKDCIIALMYEGGAEKVIIENLLNNNLLKFTWDDLLENQIFKR